MLALDFENGGRQAGVGTSLLEGNPVHEECERVAAMINPTFSINAIVDEQGLATEYLPATGVSLIEKLVVTISESTQKPFPGSARS